MRPGERRVVIVPAELGYGRSGLHLPEVPGQPRFVIPPGSLLVFDVELLNGG
jgi:FKBP-type peptidyl-prolyl cis-trans isomerase